MPKLNRDPGNESQVFSDLKPYYMQATMQGNTKLYFLKKKYRHELMIMYHTICYDS